MRITWGGRVRSYLDSVGIETPTVATLILAGLLALNAAAFASSHGVSDLLCHVTAVISTAMAALLVLISDSALMDCELFRKEAASYDKMLNDYFLVSRVDVQGRFCEANENLLRRTGYSMEG